MSPTPYSDPEYLFRKKLKTTFARMYFSLKSNKCNNVDMNMWCYSDCRYLLLFHFVFQHPTTSKLLFPFYFKLVDALFILVIIT